MFWLVVASSSFVVLCVPKLAKRNGWFSRPTEALLESLNPKYWIIIRFEAAAAILLHVGLVLVFGIPIFNYVVMNSAYSSIHEAEHGLFHSNSRINTAAGVILALFFPAPFHLIRQGHIGHHLRNRSDDEAFDLYFAEDKPVWRWLYW